MVKDFTKLIEVCRNRPDQLQVFRYTDNGQRKVVRLSEQDWNDIAEALNFVQQETRK